MSGLYYVLSVKNALFIFYYPFMCTTSVNIIKWKHAPLFVLFICLYSLMMKNYFVLKSAEFNSATPPPKIIISIAVFHSYGSVVFDPKDKNGCDNI